MNRFGDSNCRGDQGQGATETIAAGRSYGRQLLKMVAVVTALLALGGCSWFSNDEPAFPPSSGGPNIAAVPNGLPGDGGNAEYSDQELRALLGSAPRPLPPAPAAPKAADTGTPDSAAPADNAPTASTAPASGQPAAPAPAGTVPAAPVPDTSSNNANSYPDINTVPMQRPTPVPDPDATPNATAPDATTPGAASPDKPKQSSMLMPGEAGTAKLEKLQVLTTAGSSPAAPTDFVTQTAQSTGTGDDSMFSKPALPPYTGYDQTQKQPQGVPSQALYHSPYGAGGQPVPGTDGSVYYASQPGAAAQAALSPAGQQVGLVYFGIGSTTLGAADRQVLHQIAELQRAYGGVIRIVGHASSRTENMPLDKHHQTNIDIAQARAKAVAQTLVRYGVKPLFVQIAGVSDSQPLYPEIMPAGEAANRRAEIYLSSN